MNLAPSSKPLSFHLSVGPGTENEMARFGTEWHGLAHLWHATPWNEFTIWHAMARFGTLAFFLMERMELVGTDWHGLAQFGTSVAME